jgi:hypothetical protein
VIIIQEGEGNSVKVVAISPPSLPHPEWLQRVLEQQQRQQIDEGELIQCLGGGSRRRDWRRDCDEDGWDRVKSKRGRVRRHLETSSHEQLQSSTHGRLSKSPMTPPLPQ